MKYKETTATNYITKRSLVLGQVFYTLPATIRTYIQYKRIKFKHKNQKNQPTLDKSIGKYLVI